MGGMQTCRVRVDVNPSYRIGLSVGTFEHSSGTSLTPADARALAAALVAAADVAESKQVAA